MNTTSGKANHRENGKANKVDPQDRAFHNWYRFVLSFPPHLVRDYIDQFRLTDKNTLLDPFCGTGTTLVEAKLRGISSIGIEANSFAHFATSVKTNWDVDPELLCTHSQEIVKIVQGILAAQGVDDIISHDIDANYLKLRRLTPEENKLILTNSISPIPLHKVLVLLDNLKEYKDDRVYDHQLLALASTLVYSASNLHFGPEVGVGKPKENAPVIDNWLNEIEIMADDLRNRSHSVNVTTKTFFADSRSVDRILLPNSIDAVITSPPYPNEKDYTRITRLESVILGFIESKTDLRLLKKGLIRSNTRNVYKGDDDDKWIEDFPEIGMIADEIEKRRIDLGKTSGFERLYSKVTRLYFGGMARHLASLRSVLKPGARLAYVVGDQASYLRIKIQTGQLLSDIAEALGYQVDSIDLFRTRLATATKEQLREEVVVFTWKG